MQPNKYAIDYVYSLTCNLLCCLDNGTTKYVLSNEMIDKIELFQSKYVRMMNKLKKTLEKYINNPENDYSVEDMIDSVRDSDHYRDLSAFSTNTTLKHAKTVREVFTYISENCTLYDYKVLKVYINSTDCEEAVKLLNDFTTELQNSLLKQLNLLSDNLSFNSSVLPSGNQKLTIECRCIDLKCEDMKLIKKLVCKKFNLSETSIQFVGVREGSVLLVFGISVEVKQHLLQHKITAGVLASFTECLIIRFIIDDEMELKVSADYDNKVHVGIGQCIANYYTE